ncbi:hypothetical protein F5Y10DRAFT_244255 [Nemania abortiva]|nr:hypothetical protein F5Y10DRAFT_244255 [Nemania abortiva]
MSTCGRVVTSLRVEDAAKSMDPIGHSAFDPDLSSLHLVCPLPGIRLVADDWTGVTNTRERKRRQNRLNQRVYRMRRRTQNDNLLQESFPSASRGLSQRPASNWPNDSFGQYLQVDGALLLTCPRQAEHVRSLVRQALQDYSLNCPRPSQLPLIIRLNVLNAIARNALLIGIPVESLCRDEFVSPFQQAGPQPLGRPVPAPFCPDSLQPTHAQRTIFHHPWIDLFPFPRFRDNVLVAVRDGLFDDDELCLDLLGVECAGPGDRPALIIWTDAWDPRGWEVSEAFLRKWGMLLRSCPEMVQSTNYWRTKRGLTALSIDITASL